MPPHRVEVALECLNRREWDLEEAVLLCCGFDPGAGSAPLNRDPARRLLTLALGACCTGSLPTTRTAERQAPPRYFRRADGTLARVQGELATETRYFVAPRAFLDWSAELQPPMLQVLEWLTARVEAAAESRGGESSLSPGLDRDDFEILRILDRAWPHGVLLKDICDKLPHSRGNKPIVGDPKAVSKRLRLMEAKHFVRWPTRKGASITSKGRSLMAQRRR